MLGQAGRLRIDVDALQQRLQQPDYAAVQKSLADLDLGSAQNLLATYAGRLPDLSEWLGSAEINRDRSLRLQYLAGMKLNSSEGSAAYGELLGFRRFPADIFQASEPTLRLLREALQPPAATP